MGVLLLTTTTGSTDVDRGAFRIQGSGRCAAESRVAVPILFLAIYWTKIVPQQ